MLSEQEYEHLHNRLDYNLSVRNSLLTFSFTTVLTILGLAIGIDENVSVNIGIMLYLIPICILIPFTARITYYRIVYAHIESFLTVFAPEKMQFQIKKEMAPEDSIKKYSIIAVLNNYETSILSIVCAIIFYIKYYPTIDNFNVGHACILLIPILLTAMIILITMHGFNYSKYLKIYTDNWRELV